jgi:hypothetical protein
MTSVVVPLIPGDGEGTLHTDHNLSMAASQLVSYCSAIRASTSRDDQNRATFTAQNGDKYVICDADGSPVQILNGGDRSELWLTGPDAATATTIAECFRDHLARISQPRR